MKDGCLTPEEIALALGAPAHDAGRRHLEDCTWCQGLAASLNLFRRDGGLPVGADQADAEDRLEEFLEREIVGRGGEDGLDRARITRVAENPLRRWRGSMVWAAAAVLVLAVGMTTILDRGSDDAGRGIFRGGQAESGHAPQWDEIRPEPDGGVFLSWMAVEGAVGYEVILLDGSQQEAARIDAGSDTSLILGRGDLDSLASRQPPWFVRVVARDDNDEFARSLPRVLNASPD